MVFGGVYGVFAVQDPPHGAAQLPVVGVEEREVVEPGMPPGRGVPPSLPQVFRPRWW
jgi:hypothetical protein